MADIVKREFEQGFQGWEYKFNTVASSAVGTIRSSLVTMQAPAPDRFAQSGLHYHAERAPQRGRAKRTSKKPVLFPKIVFLYDENLHGPRQGARGRIRGRQSCAVRDDHVSGLAYRSPARVILPSMYKRYGRSLSARWAAVRSCLRGIVARRHAAGGRAATSRYFVGRLNIGAVSLHLPMILR